jgi:hypothetical protein
VLILAPQLDSCFWIGFLQRSYLLGHFF